MTKEQLRLLEQIVREVSRKRPAVTKQHVIANATRWLRAGVIKQTIYQGFLSIGIILDLEPCVRYADFKRGLLQLKVDWDENQIHKVFQNLTSTDSSLDKNRTLQCTALLEAMEASITDNTTGSVTDVISGAAAILVKDRVKNALLMDKWIDGTLPQFIASDYFRNALAKIGLKWDEDEATEIFRQSVFEQTKDGREYILPVGKFFDALDEVLGKSLTLPLEIIIEMCFKKIRAQANVTKSSSPKQTLTRVTSPRNTSRMSKRRRTSMLERNSKPPSQRIKTRKVSSASRHRKAALRGITSPRASEKFPSVTPLPSSAITEKIRGAQTCRLFPQ